MGKAQKSEGKKQNSPDRAGPKMARSGPYPAQRPIESVTLEVRLAPKWPNRGHIQPSALLSP